MSATARPISPCTGARDGAARARRSLEIRWEISPAAVLASQPAAALLNGEAPRLRSCALVWRIEDRFAHAELVLQLAGGELHVIALVGHTPIERHQTPGIESIDAPGALSLTLRDDDKEPLYARTTLLTDRLSLPGGVYDGPRLN